MTDRANIDFLEQHSQHPKRKLILQAQFKNLEPLRAFVAQEAETYGLDSAAVYSVQLAVDEAFTNIVEHAYGGECQENIETTCQITDDGLVITLRDCGREFNPGEVPEPDLKADLEDRKIGGLGLYFIRQLMDDVTFTFASEAGENKKCNILKMVKRKEK